MGKFGKSSKNSILKLPLISLHFVTCTWCWSFR